MSHCILHTAINGVLFFTPDQDRLFFTVYERAKIDDKSMEPHFWIYRPRISLEHLTQNLLSNENHKRYTLLNSFLQEVCLISTLNHQFISGAQFESYTVSPRHSPVAAVPVQQMRWSIRPKGRENDNWSINQKRERY